MEEFLIEKFRKDLKPEYQFVVLPTKTKVSSAPFSEHEIMRAKPKIKPIPDSTIFKAWFEKIYDEYFEKLYRYAFSITKSRDLAEDVVEEVFLNIWTRRKGNLEIKELNSYLHVSVKHIAIKILSNDPGKFVYANYEESLSVTDVIDPESLLLGDELRKIILEAVKGLPPHCSLVYDMVKNKEMSYEEVSKELGISKKTVENHLCKALAKIRDRLSKYYKHTDIRYQFISVIGTVLFLLSLLFNDLIVLLTFH